jgi:hypothetical protein
MADACTGREIPGQGRARALETSHMSPDAAGIAGIPETQTRVTTCSTRPYGEDPRQHTWHTFSKVNPLEPRQFSAKNAPRCSELNNS